MYLRALFNFTVYFCVKQLTKKQREKKEAKTNILKANKMHSTEIFAIQLPK